MADSPPSPTPGLSAVDRYRLVNDTVGTIALLVATAFIVWLNWPVSPPRIELPAEPVRLDNVAFRGRVDAPVVLVEFSDFECPFCGRFARETLPAIDEQYVKPGAVRLGFLHMPLDRLHPQARAAARAAACAGRQGRFWEMHDLLFTAGKKLDSSIIAGYGRQAVPDYAAFEACLSDESVAAQIRSDEAFARTLKITGTPALLIGRFQPDGRISFVSAHAGALPVSDLEKALDTALQGRLSWRVWAGPGVLLLATGAALTVRRRLKSRRARA